MSFAGRDVQPARDAASRKPRLLFFQNRYDSRLPPFLLAHVQEHVRCLAHFFDVTVIRNDCDYVEVCDRHQPDLVLVESGVNHVTCRRPRVANTHRNPSIPKLGLHNADAFCNARAGFLSDMEHWGIETFFAISTTAGEHTPEIADKLLYWPVFIDPQVCRDYGLPKSIPVLITGNSNSLYPWRRQVFSLLQEHYPSLACPHPGYDPAGSFSHVLTGETYARTLNAASCVPACGTVAGEAVRKHFEIPGCHACLITQRSPALEAAGFVDMVNCVFADAKDVIEKIDWLFRHPDTLAAITAAGHALAHSRHTSHARGQILEWYRLHKTTSGSDRIVQLNPFSMPVLANGNSSTCTHHVHSGGRHLQLLQEGDERLARHDLAGAENAYAACMRQMPWMPEPRLKMALCSLYRGKPDSALRWLDEITDFVLRKYRAADPDPVEWAVRILTLLCLGAHDSAAAAAGAFPGLTHLELDRVRHLCRSLMNLPGPTSAARPATRASIHVLPRRTESEWIEHVCLMLQACGQHDIVLRLQNPARGAQDQPMTLRASRWSAAEWRLRVHGCVKNVQDAVTALRCSRIRKAAAATLGTLEFRFARLIRTPHRGADDDMLTEITKRCTSNEVRTIAIIGAKPGSAPTEAALRTLAAGDGDADVFCIHDAAFPWNRPRSGSRVRWLRLASIASHMAARTSLPRGVPLNGFDLVLVDTASLRPVARVADMTASITRHAKTLMICGSGGRLGFLLQVSLLRTSRFRLAKATGGVDGYSILCRMDGAGNAMAHRPPYARLGNKAAAVATEAGRNPLPFST